MSRTTIQVIEDLYVLQRTLCETKDRLEFERLVKARKKHPAIEEWRQSLAKSKQTLEGFCRFLHTRLSAVEGELEGSIINCPRKKGWVDPQPKKKITRTDLKSLKPGTVLQTRFDCPLVIDEILLENPSTKVVFAVLEFPDGRRVPKVIKFELTGSSQIGTEERIHTKVGYRLYEFYPLVVQTDKLALPAIVMDYLGKTIDAPDLRPLAKTIFTKTLEKLYFLHSNCILHNDLKPDNILYNEYTQQVSIIDFGYAIVVDKPRPYVVDGGTNDFMSAFSIIGFLYHRYGENSTYTLGRVNIAKDEYSDPLYFPVQVMDDLIGIAYTFLEIEIGRLPWYGIIDRLKRIDDRFVKTYGKRDAESFSKWKPVTIDEKIYAQWMNLEQSPAPYGANILDGEEQEKWKSGSVDKSFINEVFEDYKYVFSISYKTQWFDYRDPKYNVPAYLKTFIETRIGDDRFQFVDIEALLRKNAGLRRKYATLNAKKGEYLYNSAQAQRAVTDEPKVYDPLYPL